MKRTSAVRIVVFAVASAFALVACGGSGSERPAASPASVAPEAPPPAQSPAGARPPNDVDGDGAPDRGDKKSERRAAATRELERAEREAQTGDCAGACRALASMERAASHLCELASGASDGAADCDDAERRVKAAREKVRAACGVCPGGPSLDRDEPTR